MTALTPTSPDGPRVRFGALLRRHRTAKHLTQAEVGQDPHIRVSPDAVATWEKGRSVPDDAIARRLDVILDADGALHRAWTVAADKPTARPTAPTGALSAASVLADSARACAEFGAWAETTNTGEVAITSLHIRIRELAQLALTEPPATVAAATADLSQSVFALLRGHQKPAHTRDLYATAGAACALLAWLAGDLGALDLAAVHNATARECADKAESVELAAWVGAVESKTDFWAGRYEKSAQTAARTAMLAPTAGTAAVMLACQQADAYAKLGDPERTRAALYDAARAADRVAEPDGFGGLFSCATGRAQNYAAASRLNIGDANGAITAAEEAFTAFRSEGGYGFGTIAQTQITQAFAFGATGAWDAAAAALRPVLDLPPERRLATLTARLAPLAAVLEHPPLRASTTAAPLREEITAYCETTTRKALPTARMEDQ